MCISFDPVFSLLGICLKEIIKNIQKDLDTKTIAEVKIGSD